MFKTQKKNAKLSKSTGYLFDNVEKQVETIYIYFISNLRVLYTIELKSKKILKLSLYILKLCETTVKSIIYFHRVNTIYIKKKDLESPRVVPSKNNIVIFIVFLACILPDT